MTNGFFTIDILAELHGDHRGQCVVMIRRGNKDGINVFANRVKHLAIVGEYFDILWISSFALKRFFNARSLVLVHFDDSNKVFFIRCLQMTAASSTTTDLHTPYFVSSIRRSENIKRCCRKNACGERSILEKGATS